MFPEIEGGAQTQPNKIGGTWKKKFENPWSRLDNRRRLTSVRVHMLVDEKLGVAAIGADAALEARSRAGVLSRVNLTPVAIHKPLVTLITFEPAPQSKTQRLLSQCFSNHGSRPSYRVAMTPLLGRGAHEKVCNEL